MDAFRNIFVPFVSDAVNGGHVAEAVGVTVDYLNRSMNKLEFLNLGFMFQVSTGMWKSSWIPTVFETSVLSSFCFTVSSDDKPDQTSRGGSNGQKTAIK